MKTPLTYYGGKQKKYIGNFKNKKIWKEKSLQQ